MPQKKSKMKDLTVPERHFGVILEDIDKTVHQVLEGHAALDKKFSKKIDDFRYEMRQEISFLRLGQSNLSHELKDLEVKFNIMDGKVDDLIKSSKQIKEYLFRIDDEIQDLKKRLDKKADLERLFQVEQKVAQIQLVVKKYFDGQNSN